MRCPVLRFVRDWWVWRTKYRPLMRKHNPQTLSDALKLIYDQRFK